MREIIWLIPALPFIGFLVLVLAGSKLPRPAVAAAGTGAPFLSAIVATLTGLDFLINVPPDHAYTRILWKWFDLDGLSASVGFYLRPTFRSDGAGSHVGERSHPSLFHPIHGGG